MASDRVARLHGLLVEELRRRGRSEAEPIPVAELCDELIPYAAVRSRLGVELNADYEDALLRLLAGVGGRVHLEPEEARQELVRELEGPYPDVGAFRKFSASRVWVEHQGAAPVPPAGAESGVEADAGVEAGEPDAASAAPGASASASAGGTALRGGAGGAGEARAGGASPGVRRSGGASSSESRGSPSPEAEGPFVPREGMPCRFCSHALPAGRRVRFCPFCGGDQRARPCPRCEAELEPGWRYCIRCGLDLPDPRPDATA